MPTGFTSVDVLREGDPQGNRMALRLETSAGQEIHALGIPQDWPSRTGPTWCYVFENEAITLIDPGAHGSFSELEDCLNFVGYSVRDIDRVVVTHGHSDHDGSIAQLMETSNSALWAHQMYAALIGYNPWEVQDRDASPIHAAMNRVVSGNMDGRSSSYAARNRRYVDSRRGLTVDHEVDHGDKVGDVEFIYAPGHSPDEICLTLGNVVFTGDHVLPEITPHPTTMAGYSDHVAQEIPAKFSDPSKSYGLKRYMTSLKTVLDLGESYAVLPAHRLFNRGRFNFVSVRRAAEVIDHHDRRLAQIIQRIDDRPTGLEDMTKGIFERRKLIGGNLFMALSEIVAHVELLEDLGDVEFTDDSMIRHTGSMKFRQFCDGLVN